MSDNFRTYALAGVIAIFCCLLYGNTVRYGFTWDDPMIMSEAKDASNIGDAALRALKTPVDRLYRPTRTFVVAVENSVFKGNPVGYHFVNLLLYATICALFFFFVLSLPGLSRQAAFIAALLFAAHHTHAETVASFGNGLADLLCASFLFPCLMLAAKGARGTARYTATLLLFAFALLSKESAAAAGLCVFALFIIHCNLTSKSIPLAVSTAALRTIPFAIVTVLFFIARTAALGGASQSYAWHGGSLRSTLLTTLSIVPEYAAMLIAPVRQCVVYVVPVISHISFGAAAGAVLLLLLIVYGILRIVKTPALAFAAISAFAFWLPVSNIIPISSIKATRFMFLPSAALCIAFAVILFSSRRDRIPTKNSKAGVLPLSAGIAIAILFTAGAHSAKIVWFSNETLWASTVTCAPGSALAWNNMGYIHTGRGEISTAEKAFRKSIKLNPIFPQPYSNLAAIYGNRGEYEKAMEMLSISRRFAGHDPLTDCKLAFCYRKLGKDAEYQALMESCAREAKAK